MIPVKASLEIRIRTRNEWFHNRPGSISHLDLFPEVQPGDIMFVTGQTDPSQNGVYTRTEQGLERITGGGGR